MAEHEIGFVCTAITSVEDIAKLFYDNFDGAIAARDGQVFVTVDVDTDDVVKAALVAVDQLAGMGLQALRIDRDLVDSSEIASRLGRSRQNVQQWATGARQEDFPAPAASIGGKRVWEWADVVQWSNDAGVSELPLGVHHADATEVDHELLRRRQLRTNAELIWSGSQALTYAPKGEGLKSGAEYSGFVQTHTILTR